MAQPVAVNKPLPKGVLADIVISAAAEKKTTQDVFEALQDEGYTLAENSVTSKISNLRGELRGLSTTYQMDEDILTGAELIDAGTFKGWDELNKAIKAGTVVPVSEDDDGNPFAEPYVLPYLADNRGHGGQSAGVALLNRLTGGSSDDETDDDAEE